MSRAGGRRRRARELAMRVLFEVEGSGKDATETLAYQIDEMGAADDVAGFGRALVMGTLRHIDAIFARVFGASRPNSVPKASKRRLSRKR